ncbi:unnamed protein product [Pleuronectes platessa]|uniref:Uncharacterized protein n=1 Tax=Pleuronectes platessa TaxID=8262 RepID=A0A9N7Z377_PLEPL|nr:unnamed protein product [Pleuronectes platessa]
MKFQFKFLSERKLSKCPRGFRQNVPRRGGAAGKSASWRRGGVSGGLRRELLLARGRSPAAPSGPHLSDTRAIIHHVSSISSTGSQTQVNGDSETPPLIHS